MVHGVHGVTRNRTERLHFSLFTFMHWRRKWQPTPVGGNGEAWWAAVYGVTHSRKHWSDLAAVILNSLGHLDIHCYRDSVKWTSSWPFQKIDRFSFCRNKLHNSVGEGFPCSSWILWDLLGDAAGTGRGRGDIYFSLTAINQLLWIHLLAWNRCKLTATFFPSLSRLSWGGFLFGLGRILVDLRRQECSQPVVSCSSL